MKRCYGELSPSTFQHVKPLLNCFVCHFVYLVLNGLLFFVYMQQNQFLF